MSGHESDHGHGGDESLTDMIVSIFMVLFLAGPILDKSEETAQEVLGPQGGHGGH